jgi:hypothetical protein
VQKQAARSRPTRRFQFRLGSLHGRHNFSSNGSPGGYSRRQDRCAGDERWRGDYRV